MDTETADGKQNFKIPSIFFSELKYPSGILHASRRFSMQSDQMGDLLQQHQKLFEPF